MSGGGPRPEGPGEVVELWRAPDGLWRWRYLEPSADSRPRAFLSNKEYETRELALRSATTAYPGVPVFEPTTEHEPVAGDGSAGRGRRLLPLALLAVGAALVLWARRRRGPVRSGRGRAEPREPRARYGRSARSRTRLNGYRYGRSSSSRPSSRSR